MAKKENQQGTRLEFRKFLLSKLNLSYTVYARLPTERKLEIYKQYTGGGK
ncbi:MAG: hypothetical protein AABY22_36070 [Nanoarchaeota archaeon]